MRRHLLLIGLVPFFFAACSSTPTTPVATSPVAQATPTPVAPAKPAAPVANPATPSTALAMHLDPNSALSRQHSVYFDFDDSVVHTEYTPVIERHGQYLLQHQNLTVVVQGNADERGSSEYNLALGQRRAEAVKSALRIYGVKDSQIEAVSFGREKPVAMGHDESAWHLNRRADIVYPR